MDTIAETREIELGARRDVQSQKETRRWAEVVEVGGKEYDANDGSEKVDNARRCRLE